MNLKCKINGKEYPIVQGLTFSDEYNETLDSGSIIISQVDRIDDIQPYDDVYIYDNEFNGYQNRNEKIDLKNEIKFILTEQEEQGDIESGYYVYLEISDFAMRTLFSGHLMKYSLRINFIEVDKDGVAKENFCDAYIKYENEKYYFEVPQINMKEELKESLLVQGLYILKNELYYTDKYDVISVIEFLAEEFYHENNNKNTFYKHLLIDKRDRNILRLENEEISQYVILLMSETKYLEKIPLPNFSITQPLNIDLKKNIYDYMVDIVEMYSPIYKVVDPSTNNGWKYQKKYVVDPSLKNVFGDTYSPDFTLNNPNLRDVLSQLMIVKDMIPYVEDGMIKAMDITQRKGEFNIDGVNYISTSLGSSDYCTSLKRTYSDALSEQKSCRLTEYLGFKNSDNSLMTIDNMRLETTYPIYKINKMYMCYYKKVKISKEDGSSSIEKAFLCKQDISKLVKLNSERNVLSEDWSVFNNTVVKDVETLSKFKLGTIGYDIGSKFIDGWGSKYTSYALFNWFPKANTYVQKILEFMDTFYTYGIYNYGYLRDKLKVGADEYIVIDDDINYSLVSPFKNQYPAGLKGLFFEIEYESFYNGTIYHSKDNLNRDDIVTNDNSSSSLTLLEQDGVMQKEKVNRFGNEVFKFDARYTDISQLQELGSVYTSKDGKDTDIIIYSREYSIQDNVINCKYVGAKDYVLKNYFTTVYAKHRPYNLMSYGESVYRSENKKIFLLFDLDKKYIENNGDVLQFKRFGDFTDEGYDFSNGIDKVVSFFKKTLINQKSDFLNFDKINYGFFEHNGKKYVSDTNVFVNGNSLCFNLKMYDNASAGVYINTKNLEPITNFIDFTTYKDDVVGSLQDWYLVVDNEETGFIEKMGFYVGHIEQNDYIGKDVVDDIDEIIGKKEVSVSVLGSEYSENDNILTPGIVTETKRMNILKPNTIYNKIFSLPKIDKNSSEISNLIGNEFLVKKDNKELIDMTFQIEPITNNEKILFSPWMMRLSDLNGNYNKMISDITVSGSDVSNLFKIPVKTYEFTTYRTANLVENEKYFNPIMILSFNPNNLSKNGISDDTTLEGILETKDFIEFPVTFTYNTPRNDAFLGTGIHSVVNKLVFNINKIINYDKENGYIDVNCTQQVNYFNNYFGIKFKNKSANDEKTIRFKIINNTSYRGLKIPEDEKWFVFDTIVDKISFDNAKEPIYYKCSNNKVIELYNSVDVVPNITELNYGNSNIITTYFAGTGKFEYPQNMFITISSTPMKKHHVYNQYKDLREIGLSDYNTGPLVSDVIYFADDDKLVVDLYQFERDRDNVKCVQLWYKDEGGALNFVFGVNVDEDDFKKRKVEIHISLITHKDMRVFDNMHNVIGYVKNVANSEVVEDLTQQKYEKNIEK